MFINFIAAHPSWNIAINVSNMLKDIYESQILPRATVEELWQWKMVFLPVLSVGEDLSSVERWARISKRLIFIIIDFHLDACCRRMYLTSTLMLLPMWSGSMKRFWVWVACSPVATLWRKYFQRVSPQTNNFFIKVSFIIQALELNLPQSVENLVIILFVKEKYWSLSFAIILSMISI